MRGGKIPRPPRESETTPRRKGGLMDRVGFEPATFAGA